MNEEEIFHQALARSPEERPAFLEQACAGNPSLRAAVESLLRANVGATGFLEQPSPAPGATLDEPLRETPGTVIGQYKLIEQIGEGGMGTVWMAQQTEPVKRLVALKLIKAGMDSKQVIARFEAERQALALMDHPNIAKVFDGGTTGEPSGVSRRVVEADETRPLTPLGTPYFVMELVKGVPITKYCDEHHLTPRQRLELFIPVCQAVQHAHQKGVIHRDIKPSNVLVAHPPDPPLGKGGPGGVPKVIDFGVAKAAGQSLTDKTLVTGFGNIVGTLEYMSPEQAEVNQLDIDTRSDIYSLGVLLYELLAGSPPFTRKELEKAGMLEMLRVIREQEPTKPSTKLSTAEGLPTLAANRGTEPAKLTRLVRGELDWIVMKALEKDRNRRYETANGFAMDVQRYLADEQVLACPPSTGYRLRKFVRRNKAAVGAGAVAAASMMVVVIGLLISNVRIDREKMQKEAALAEAEANLGLARQAVDEMYTDVAYQLNVLPHMQPYQRDVFQKALRFYEEFARRKSGDPAIRLETARATRLVLSIKHTMGQRGPFEEPCREVIAELEQLAREMPSEPKCRLALAEAHTVLGTMVAESGRRRAREEHYRKALALLGELAAERPDVPDYRRRLASMHNSLGGTLRDQTAEAEKCHREAIRLCEVLAAEQPDEPLYHGELSNSYFLLGSVRAEARQFSQAEDALRQSIAICDKAGDPLARTGYRSLTSQARYHLAQVLQTQRRTQEAETAYREAIASTERLVAQFPDIPSYRQSLVAYCLELAKLFIQTGRPEQAAPFSRRAFDLSERLLAAKISGDAREREEAISDLIGLTSALRDAGELKDAERAARRVIELLKDLAVKSPGEPSYQHRLAHAHGALGTVLFRARRFQEAADAHREQLSISGKLSATFPDDPDYRYFRATAANFLGIALRHLPKERDAAPGHHRDAIRLNAQLLAEFPDEPRYRIQLARSHYALGLAHWVSGRWTDAQAAYREALDAAAPLPDHAAYEPGYPPLPPSIQNDWAWLLATCADAKLRNPRRAVELATKAVEADPRRSYCNTLGAAHYRAGNLNEALAALQKSMDLRKGGDSFDWFFVAMAHWQLGKKDEARAWCAKAGAWMNKHAPDNDELRRFRAEAEELMGVKK